MLKFNNELVEKVCEQILTKEENRLKIIYRSVLGPAVVPTYNEYLELCKQELTELYEAIEQTKKVITLGELAIELGAKLKDEE